MDTDVIDQPRLAWLIRLRIAHQSVADSLSFPPGNAGAVSIFRQSHGSATRPRRAARSLRASPGLWISGRQGLLILPFQAGGDEATDTITTGHRPTIAPKPPRRRAKIPTSALFTYPTGFA